MNYKKINWYFNRLKAMNMAEICWRVSQKKIEKNEKNIYSNKNIFIIDNLLNKDLISLINKFNNRKMHINYSNNNYLLNEELWLFEKYDYNELKNKWHYGFNTKNEWSKKFSYDLSYKQNDDIGDARTNWELNRHFQFTILAKNYYLTKDKKYLKELKYLFYNWNLENPFLIGISWTSVMEVSIRAYSWIMTLVFLQHSKLEDDKILKDLEIGIINMVDYTNKHHSRYSSANNHLIVEMIVIGIAGVMFDYEDWYKKAIGILDKELFIQNYNDGVNKEHAPHYQTFVMEAISLFMLVLKRNSIEYPKTWNELLAKMSGFISDLMDENYNVPHLGDSDEGKILDLSGKHLDHYKYVLEFTSVLLNKKYISLDDVHENINWLFTENEIKNINEIYNNKFSKCYKEGGYTIMKSIPSCTNNIVITIDHAELGFGSIAAHGHADSLSFTMNVNGNKVFIDPGTYIYHVDLESRDYFRKTINHNTICINNIDQSEMLGAFLWGKRANTKLDKYEIKEDEEYLLASHNGYKPIIHKREFIYDRSNKIKIKDMISGSDFEWINTLVLHSDVEVIKIHKNTAELKVANNIIKITTSNEYNIEIEDIWISEVYNNKIKSKAIKIIGKNKSDLELITQIEVY